MKRKGFTLVEALVVIAIIVVLLAILIPAIAAVSNMHEERIQAHKIEIESAKSNWSIVDMPYNSMRTRLIYSVIEVDGQRFLVATKDCKECPLTIEPLSYSKRLKAEVE